MLNLLRQFAVGRLLREEAVVRHHPPGVFLQFVRGGQGENAEGALAKLALETFGQGTGSACVRSGAMSLGVGNEERPLTDSEGGGEPAGGEVADDLAAARHR